MTTDIQCPLCRGVHYSSYNAERCRVHNETHVQARARGKARSTSRRRLVPADEMLGQVQEAQSQIQGKTLRAGA